MSANWTVSMISPSRLRGSISYKFANVERQPFVYFDLAANLTIDSIVYHGNRVTPVRNGDTLFIPVTGIASDSVSISYQGFPRRRDFGAYTFGQHAGAPIIWTMSPPYGSRDWWPSRVRLTEKLDSLDISITCPRGNRAVSQGRLTKIDTLAANNQLRFNWKHRYPIAHYLVSLGVTNYDLIRDSVRLRNGFLPIELYPYPENRQAAITLLPQLKRTLQLFDSLFIPYPFTDEKYGMAQYGYGGGMENQTISFVGDWSRNLAAHELGHQWFGNWVTCGTMKDMWLNEGLATWLEELTIEHFDGQAAIRAERAARNRQLLTRPIGSITVPDTLDYLRIYNGTYTYLKGGIYARIIRNELKDSLFFGGIRQFLNQHGRGFARSTDWLNSFNQISGRDLSPIHSLWLDNPSVQPVFVNLLGDTTQLTPAFCVKHRLDLTPMFGFDTLFDQRLRPSRVAQNNCATLYYTPSTATRNWIVNADHQYPMPAQLVTKNVTRARTAIAIYPNPTSDYLSIGYLPGEATIELLDISGKSIFANRPIANDTPIDLSAISPGTYVILINSGSSQYRQLVSVVK